MSNFGGEFRRKPQQSLGGASTKQSKESLMKTAAEERKKREDHKKHTESANKIQAFFRSFFCRIKKKSSERSSFDSLISDFNKKLTTTTKRHAPNSNTQNAVQVDDVHLLVTLTRKFNFFIDINNEDDQKRLIHLSQAIMTKQKLVFNSLPASPCLLFNLKRLLLSCCRLIQKFSQDTSLNLSIPLRMLEIFTDAKSIKTATASTTTSTSTTTTSTTTLKSTNHPTNIKPTTTSVKTASQTITNRQILSDVKLFLSANGYFKTIHHLLIYRVPASIHQHNYDLARIPMTSTIHDLLSRFLIFDDEDDEGYRKIIIKGAVDELFSVCLSAQMKHFLLPTLSGSTFPFVDVLKTLQQQRQQQHNSKDFFLSSPLSFLYCLLVLGKPHYETLSEGDMATFLSVLDDQMENFNTIDLSSKKDPTRPLLSIPNEDDDADRDADDDDDVTVEMDWLDDTQSGLQTCSDKQLKQLCVDFLCDDANLSNSLFNQLTNHNSSFYDVNDDVSAGECSSALLSLCRICYTVLQYDRKLIVHKFRLLNVLSFNPYFIERVWLLISSVHSKSVLNEKTYLLQWIARGSNLVGEDFRRIIPLVSTLSIIFNYYLLTISDAEFHGKRGTKKVMPFNNLQAVSQLALALRDFCLGVIELSHPESRSLMINYSRLSHNMATRAPSSTALKSRFTALTSPTAALTSQAAALTSSSPVPSYSERFIMRQRQLLYVFKDAVKLLKQLYERDCRESYCPAGSWLASNNLYHSEKFIQPLSSTASVFVGCAFGTLSILNSDEASLSVDQPILSTSEVRKLIILSELPFVISFQDRVKIFHDLVRRDKMENQPDHAGLYGNTIIIRRNYIYEDAFEKLSPENEPNLKGRLQIKLINAAGLDEAGVDGGGLFREFMSELVKTGFDPNLGFFKMTPDKLLYPNFQSNLIWKDDYLKHYFFLGRVLGKVIYENMLIEVPFASFFLAKLLSRHKGLLDMHYLASLDPELHRNLLFIKDYEGDVLDMQLDFTVNYEVLGQLKVDELKPNGRNIQVTNSNRYEYMYLMADYKLNRQIRQHCSAFRAGLADVLNISWLRMFDHNELQILISGANVPIDVDDLRRNCNYSGGYTVGHPLIQMFWQVVEDFDDSQRQQLLKFVTSCSRPPLMGFKELYPPFCIHHAGTDLDRLPTSSTCMNLLKLPEFKDKGSLKQKLLYAIESGAGFELS